MKITITLEVPDGTKLTMGNDSEYLSHEEHPEYAEKLRMRGTTNPVIPITPDNPNPSEIKRLLAEIDHVKKLNSALAKLVKHNQEERLEVPAPAEVRLPIQSFACLSCAINFPFATISSQARCPQCGIDCDLTAAPKDDLSTIPCTSCGEIYKKETGGKFGTCPKCTTVRCPTCKNPASLSEMVGQMCSACRGGK